MDNYLIAEQGVKKAADILEIDVPMVAVLTNPEAEERDINSLFLKDEYTIGFNESRLDSADPIEVLITCFHEARHAFQWRAVSDQYSGTTRIDLDTKSKWKNEFDNYVPSFGKLETDDQYLKQEIEIDAITFAHFQALNL